LELFIHTATRCASQLSAKQGAPNPLEGHLNEVKQQVQQMQAVVQEASGRNDVSQVVDSLRRDVQNVHQAVSTQQEDARRAQSQLISEQKELHVKVEKSSAFGFWSYFLFFQVCFAVAGVIYKMQRDSAQKKMF
jgi:hypothetical protein